MEFFGKYDGYKFAGYKYEFGLFTENEVLQASQMLGDYFCDFVKHNDLEPVETTVIDWLKEGRKGQAVLCYRKLHNNCSLIMAREVVEKIHQDLKKHENTK